MSFGWCLYTLPHMQGHLNNGLTPQYRWCLGPIDLPTRQWHLQLTCRGSSKALLTSVCSSYLGIFARTEVWFKFHQCGIMEWEGLIQYVRMRFALNNFKTYFAEHIWNQVELNGVHATNIASNKRWLSTKFLEACRYAEPVSFSAEDAK